MRTNTFKLLLGISALLVLQSCGEEIARLPINKISNAADQGAKEVTLDLQEGDEVYFWSDMELYFKRDISLHFHIHITRNGHNYKSIELNPFEKNTNLGSSQHVEFKDENDLSFFEKNSHLRIDQNASYTFRSYLVASDNPSLRIKKAELVLMK